MQPPAAGTSTTTHPGEGRGLRIGNSSLKVDRFTLTAPGMSPTRKQRIPQQWYRFPRVCHSLERNNSQHDITIRAGCQAQQSCLEAAAHPRTSHIVSQIEIFVNYNLIARPQVQRDYP